jgi:transposase
VIQLTAATRILVAVDRVDFRRGIDGLSQVCRAVLSEDPMDGTVFIFRSRSAKAIKLLVYDGQGFWLAQKRLSAGKFRYWPTSGDRATRLMAHQFHTLIWGGDPTAVRAAPLWRRLGCELARAVPS